MPTSNLTISPPIEYRELSDLPGYCYGSDGSVWTRKKLGYHSDRPGDAWRPLKPTRQYKGHMLVYLYVNKQKVSRLVHRLILEAFVGPCPEGMECRHLDGNPGNNRLRNLVWGTHKENHEDSVRHGTAFMFKGQRGTAAKLTDQQVIDIRRLVAMGENTKVLGAQYGVRADHIRRIARRQVWKNL